MYSRYTSAAIDDARDIVELVGIGVEETVVSGIVVDVVDFLGCNVVAVVDVVLVKVDEAAVDETVVEVVGIAVYVVVIVDIFGVIVVVDVVGEIVGVVPVNEVVYDNSVCVFDVKDTVFVVVVVVIVVDGDSIVLIVDGNSVVEILGTALVEVADNDVTNDKIKVDSSVAVAVVSIVVDVSSDCLGLKIKPGRGGMVGYSRGGDVEPFWFRRVVWSVR